LLSLAASPSRLRRRQQRREGVADARLGATEVGEEGASSKGRKRRQRLVAVGSGDAAARAGRGRALHKSTPAARAGSRVNSAKRIVTEIYRLTTIGSDEEG
ncbi:hypothetical protein GW17_00043324, partial [Ensete ventricosum]